MFPKTLAHTITHARSSCGLALWSSCWGERLSVGKCLPVQTQDYPRNQFWLFFCKLIRKLLPVSQKLVLHMIWGHKYPYRNGIFCNMLKNYIDKIRTRDCNISKYMLKYTKDCHFQIVQKCFFFFFKYIDVGYLKLTFGKCYVLFQCIQIL